MTNPDIGLRISICGIWSSGFLPGKTLVLADATRTSNPSKPSEARKTNRSNNPPHTNRLAAIASLAANVFQEVTCSPRPTPSLFTSGFGCSSSAIASSPYSSSASTKLNSTYPNSANSPLAIASFSRSTPSDVRTRSIISVGNSPGYRGDQEWPHSQARGSRPFSLRCLALAHRFVKLLRPVAPRHYDAPFAPVSRRQCWHQCGRSFFLFAARLFEFSRGHHRQVDRCLGLPSTVSWC